MSIATEYPDHSSLHCHWPLIEEGSERYHQFPERVFTDPQMPLPEGLLWKLPDDHKSKVHEDRPAPFHPWDGRTLYVLRDGSWIAKVEYCGGSGWRVFGRSHQGPIAHCIRKAQTQREFEKSIYKGIVGISYHYTNRHKGALALTEWLWTGSLPLPEEELRQYLSYCVAGALFDEIEKKGSKVLDIAS